MALAPGVVVGIIRIRFDAFRHRLPKEEPYMTAYASMVLLSRVVILMVHDSWRGRGHKAAEHIDFDNQA